MERSQEPVRLAGSVLDDVRHVCAFFHNVGDKYRVILPFMCEGLRAGDRVFAVIDEASRREHLRKLAEGGIDVEQAQSRGQLELRRREDAYLGNGRFDQEKMLALIESSLRQGRAAGFQRTRFIADMDWPPGPDVEDVVHYQQRLDELAPRCDDVIVSTYDCAKFGAGIVMDILRTQPIVIIGGILQKNPFFVSPDEFLRELRARRATESGEYADHAYEA